MEHKNYSSKELNSVEFANFQLTCGHYFTPIPIWKLYEAFLKFQEIRKESKQ
jgi:hypothetical protein